MPIALFPGQGVQAPGMDRGLVETVPDVFETASDLLGIDVAGLCQSGATADASLASTRWAQPAVLVCSFAAFRELADHGQTFTTVTGHSVGEYAALVACEALTFPDALRLIAKRAELTAEISAATSGAMAALMRIQIGDAVALCEQMGVSLAADNADGACVISGGSDRIEAAITAAAATRSVARRLDVDGAFHSPLMAPAGDALSEVLSSMDVRPPAIAFWSSTTASRLEDPEAIRNALVQQLTGCVRWRETLLGIAGEEGSDEMIDIGPGRVVGTLARRIVPDATIRYADDLLPAAAS